MATFEQTVCAYARRLHPVAAVARDLAAVRCVSREVGACTTPGWKAVNQHCRGGPGLVRAVCSCVQGKAALKLRKIAVTIKSADALTSSCADVCPKQGQHRLAHHQDEGVHTLNTLPPAPHAIIFLHSTSTVKSPGDGSSCQRKTIAQIAGTATCRRFASTRRSACRPEWPPRLSG